MSRYTSKHTGSEIDSAIDRAKAGGAIDTLLAGKAPAGYGLGGNAADPTTNDADSCTLTGWYAISSMSNCPFTYGLLRVEKWYDGCIFQTAYEMSSGVVVQRRYQNSEWKPWEYVNPPMKLGVEYRTTERYLGKPVYVMMVDGLSSSAGAWKQVSNFGSNVDELVRYTATGVESTYNEIVPIPSTIGDGYKTEGGVVKTVINNIYIIYKCNNRGLSNVKFTLYYTKTTD